MRNMIEHGANRQNPPISSFEMVERRVYFSFSLLASRSGICITKRRIAEAAPMGRLI